ncbi:hypothetical protein [Chitinophaga agri]|uniref:Uncharacterized protein n=1 Tax=Chitinophaga agri TaxID=2703787 RepID=A0A6B9ZEI1_9BACT|nr:hypothetical protein [Chitinophaga agri]QHS60842.1 hypothetical protein GWR21_14925 [Chitinophaga agri]
MITSKNYFEKVKDIDPSRFSADLRERYDYVKEVTEDHSTWDFYNADNDIKAAVDQYLADFSDYLNKQRGGQTSPTENEAREVAKKLIHSSVSYGETAEAINKGMVGVYNGKEEAQLRSNKIFVTKVAGQKVDYKFPLRSIYNELLKELGGSAPTKPVGKPAKKRQQNKPRPSASKPRVSVGKTTKVERISEDVRFIKRYLLMHGKKKTDMQILNFLSALQKAIVEKRVRKSSPYAHQIDYIQKNLVKLYNDMGRIVEIKVRDSVLIEFLEIAGSEQVRLSVSYMKRYMGMQGKNIDKEKAKRLHSLVSTALDKGKISKTDPYREKIIRIITSLKQFIDKAKPSDTLKLHSTVLNGINEVLDGCCPDCDKKEKLNGMDDTDAQPLAGPGDDIVMNSMAFSGMQFETLGFMGKWREFIGDPAPGFSAMVSARPKMGKSYLCADFAGYLAEHHGETLFVAGEEKLSHTLQQKIEAVKHPCLHVTGKLPDDLSPYDFIVLDSVTRLRLTPNDLRSLKERYPRKSFIYVYQVTKAGQFRGSQEAQHDVDVVIEVPEKGRAVQSGRYNQGGEMDIFEPKDIQAA